MLIHEPVTVTRLGRRILEVVDPDGADARLGAALERDEARSAREQFLRLTPDGSGATRLSGRLAAEDAAALRAVLDPLSAPRPAADDGPDCRPADRRAADALGEACRLLLRSGELPHTGGAPAQVTVVMVDWERLRDGLASARLGPDADAVSVEAARRIACDADLLPALLGGAGEVLDLGRRARLFTGALRRALDVRDRGCAFPGCTRPQRWCDAHHILGWWAGGPTTLDNGVLLCGWHHRLVHAGDWSVQLGTDRLPEFVPPAWVDPQRRPRRNLRLRT